jgi:GntR family transcriptional regulator
MEEQYQPGDKLPTEQELVDLLDISRSTLREGLHLLEEEHIIRTKHGTGRYLVSTPNDYKFDITRLQGATEMLADYNIQVTTRVVEVREGNGDELLGKGHPFQPGEDVLWIERIRYAEKIPVIYSIDVVPRRFLANPWDESMFTGSLLQLLQEHSGLDLDYSRATLRVVLTDEYVSRCDIGDQVVPWILFEQINYDRNDEPIIFSKDYHRSDYITFQVTRYRH